jgi:alpha-amylase
LFGCEWNINLLGGGHNELAYYAVPGRELEDWHLDSSGELENVAAITLGNRQLGIEIQLQLEPEARLWRFPVQTVSNSEAGVELVYQGSCLLPLFPMSVYPGQKAHLHLAWLVRNP